MQCAKCPSATYNEHTINTELNKIRIYQRLVDVSIDIGITISLNIHHSMPRQIPDDSNNLINEFYNNIRANECNTCNVFYCDQHVTRCGGCGVVVCDRNGTGSKAHDQVDCYAFQCVGKTATFEINHWKKEACNKIFCGACITSRTHPGTSHGGPYVVCDEHLVKCASCNETLTCYAGCLACNYCHQPICTACQIECRSDCNTCCHKCSLTCSMTGHEACPEHVRRCQENGCTNLVCFGCEFDFTIACANCYRMYCPQHTNSHACERMQPFQERCIGKVKRGRTTQQCSNKRRRVLSVTCPVHSEEVNEDLYCPVDESTCGETGRVLCDNSDYPVCEWHVRRCIVLGCTKMLCIASPEGEMYNSTEGTGCCNGCNATVCNEHAHAHPCSSVGI